MIHFHNILCMYGYNMFLTNHVHSSPDVSSTATLGMSYFGRHPSDDSLLPRFFGVGVADPESTRGRENTGSGDGCVTKRLSSLRANSSSDSGTAPILSRSSCRESGV